MYHGDLEHTDGAIHSHHARDDPISTTRADVSTEIPLEYAGGGQRGQTSWYLQTNH
jgi:hypothetical protein